jgi:hypothetical protein
VGLLKNRRRDGKYELRPFIVLHKWCSAQASSPIWYFILGVTRAPSTFAQRTGALLATNYGTQTDCKAC